MCGIFGVVSDDGLINWQKRKNFVVDALSVGTIRGEDSTGMFFVPRQDVKHEFTVIKNTEHGSSFKDIKEVESKLRFIDHFKYTIGHHRSATTGNICDEHAHPFIEGPITLVHNGTLTSWRNRLINDKTVVVDSHAIAKALSVAENVKDVLEKLTGAYALVWHDKRDDSLNIARNDKRPLHHGFPSGGNTMLIASEAGMLSWIADRNGLELKKIYSYSPGTHYKYFYEKQNNKSQLMVIKSEFTVNKKEFDYYDYGDYSKNHYTHQSAYHGELEEIKSYDISQGKESVFMCTGLEGPYRNRNPQQTNTTYTAMGYDFILNDNKIPHHIKVFSLPEDGVKDFVNKICAGEIIDVYWSYVTEGPVVQVKDIMVLEDQNLDNYIEKKNSPKEHQTIIKRRCKTCKSRLTRQGNVIFCKTCNEDINKKVH